MRLHAGLFVWLLIWPVGSVVADPPEWERMQIGQGAAAFVAVAVDPTVSTRVLAATRRALYESLDGGQSWQERFRVPADVTISALAVGADEPKTVLIATDHGLYGSLDGGTQWSRLFRGAGEGEGQGTSVAFHPARRGTALLATRGGLLISYGDGRSWAEVRTPLAARDVVSFTFDPNDPDHLYLVTTQRLFIGSLADGNWQQRFSLPAAEDVEATGDENVNETEAIEAEGPTHVLSAVAVDPREPFTLYLAGSRGLQMSTDAGSTWQSLTRVGLTSPVISRILPYRYSPLVLYAATTQGVARYEPEHDRWKIMAQGLVATQVNDLAATQHQIWAATAQGLYRLSVAPDQFSESEPPSAQELLANFSYEPTIAQVREAAIWYAEVHPDKIRRWRRQASLKALLPTVNFGMDRDTSRDIHVDEGSFPNFQILETADRDRGLDLSITWDLGELMWNDDQTSIDVRSKLMVQLRDGIVDEVTRTYFERRRLQIKLLTEPPTDQQTILEKELRLQELTALIDGLTGGYFSQQAAGHENQ